MPWGLSAKPKLSPHPIGLRAFDVDGSTQGGLFPAQFGRGQPKTENQRGMIWCRPTAPFKDPAPQGDSLWARRLLPRLPLSNQVMHMIRAPMKLNHNRIAVALLGATSYPPKNKKEAHVQDAIERGPSPPQTSKSIRNRFGCRSEQRGRVRCSLCALGGQRSTIAAHFVCGLKEGWR